MATLEQETNLRNQLKTVLVELAGINASDLVRAKELGPDLSFESGVLFFSRMLRLFHSLDDSNLDDISFQKMSQILQQANEVVALFRNIKEFSLAKYASSPIAMRNQFIDQIRDKYDSVFEMMAPTIAFTIRKGTDFERLEEQAKETLKRIDKSAQDHETALKTSRDSAEQILQEVRRIAVESGVAQHAIHFKQEADNHEKSAKTWLRATGFLAGGTVLVGIAFLVSYMMFQIPPSPSQSLQIALSKIVIFTLLFTATLWAGRTYRAHRHNGVINRHRQNALATFQAFVKAAGDDQTRNAVLLQATQCIFAPQPTGYIAGEPEVGGIPQVLEIVRNLGKPN